MRILFATDGSEGSLSAARFLCGLGHHRDVHVHIVTARDNGDPDDGAAQLNATRTALGEFAGHVTLATFRADSTSEIVDGVLDTARISDANLIVVGARGQSAVARFLVGSVAEAVARHADVPVLVARQQESGAAGGGEVVVGIDGSRSAHDAALFAANDLPLPSGCRLRLVNVLQHPRWAAYPSLLAVQGVSTLVEQTERVNATHAEVILSGLRQELKERTAALETEVVYGDPSGRLTEIARDRGAGLIVVGSRGLSGPERLLIGSVSDRVLWNAPCSVLVYHQLGGGE